MRCRSTEDVLVSIVVGLDTSEGLGNFRRWFFFFTPLAEAYRLPMLQGHQSAPSMALLLPTADAQW